MLYLPKTIFFADLTKVTLLELTNEQRESLGLRSLVENSKLNRAAYLKAQDMLTKDYFGHLSPTGLLSWHWFKEAGYDYQYAGENLAIGFLDSEEVYQAWNGSLPHKTNLVNPNYQDIGIAVVKGDFQGNETAVVVQLFASPKATLLTKESMVVVEGEKKELEVIGEEKETLKEIAGKEQVAGPSEEALTQAEAPSFQREEMKNGFGYNFLKFMTTNYNNLVQNIIFYSLLVITISLVINIFIKFDLQHKDLVLKTFFFIILLVLFISVDKELIIKFIPHNFFI